MEDDARLQLLETGGASRILANDLLLREQMNRAYYTDSIDGFLDKSSDEIVGILVQSHAFALDPTQRDAWTVQITILRDVLLRYRGEGQIHFEYSIPRL